MYKLLAPALLLAFTTTLIADELRGKVVSIADGDTITVLDENKKQNKVRLNGIDAPEKKQPLGPRAKPDWASWWLARMWLSNGRKRTSMGGLSARFIKGLWM